MDSRLQRIAAVLGHDVPAVLPPGDCGWVAASLAGVPPVARVAWVDDDDRVLARVACPAGRPSRWRPIVAAEVTLNRAPGRDRVIVGVATPGVTAVQPVMALEQPPPPAPVAGSGLVLVRIPSGVALLGVDAIGHAGEPIGRLDRVGMAELSTSGAEISGRLGAGHGMAAGIGHGHWVEDLDRAAFEAGFAPRLPDRLPPGLGDPVIRIEPDLSYPAAPPAVIVAWEGEEHARVLVRQAVAPLASPDSMRGAGTTLTDVHGVKAVLRGRGRFTTLVWETPDRAFGIQVRSMDDPDDVALAVARSIPAADGDDA